eukprot:symbB.v1.2.004191.t1/scaffold236.1/size256932/1
MSSLLYEFGPLTGDLLTRSTTGVLQGLNYLHTRNPPVVHRDIKGANILVDVNFTVKLSDFGCSKRSNVQPAQAWIPACHNLFYDHWIHPMDGA